MSPDGRVALDPGFVLHRRPYRDTSLLLELFTETGGRLGAVSRGARGARSPLKGLLQPFQPLLLSWGGRGELRTLTGAEAAGRSLLLRGPALAAGFYLNELLLRLLQRHDPNPELYRAYGRALPRLAEPGMEWTLRLFERDLLQALGYGLLLAETPEGEPVQPQERYCYHLESGPVPGAAGGLQLSGAALLALETGEAPGETEQGEVKRLMRAALQLYLGDRPLASRELFRPLATSAPDRTNDQQGE